MYVLMPDGHRKADELREYADIFSAGAPYSG